MLEFGFFYEGGEDERLPTSIILEELSWMPF